MLQVPGRMRELVGALGDLQEENPEVLEGFPGLEDDDGGEPEEEEGEGKSKDGDEEEEVSSQDLQRRLARLRSESPRGEGQRGLGEERQQEGGLRRRRAQQREREGGGAQGSQGRRILGEVQGGGEGRQEAACRLSEAEAAVVQSMPQELQATETRKRGWSWATRRRRGRGRLGARGSTVPG